MTTVTLAEIRERADKRLVGLASDAGIMGAIESAADVPLLLAAVEAVLKLADEWDRVDARLSEMGHESAPIGDLRREMAFSHAKVFEDCAQALREAITSALSGAAPVTPEGKQP